MNDLQAQVEKTQDALDKAVTLLKVYESQFEQVRLSGSVEEFTFAQNRLAQQRARVSALADARDSALHALSAAQNAVADAEQRKRDERELADLNGKAHALKAEIEQLNATASTIPPKLESAHQSLSLTLKRIAELQSKLTPPAKPQLASWYKDTGSVGARLSEVFAK